MLVRNTGTEVILLAKKTTKKEAFCRCCGTRMEIAAEIAPELDAADQAGYCQACGPKPRKEPFCRRCEDLRG